MDIYFIYFFKKLLRLFCQHFHFQFHVKHNKQHTFKNKNTPSTLSLVHLQFVHSALLFLRVVPSPSWQPVRGPVISLEWSWLPHWCSWAQNQPHRSRYHSQSSHFLRCFSHVRLLVLIGSPCSVTCSVNQGVSRLTPLSPAVGDDCNTDTSYFVCVSRISVSTTWAALAVSYWITVTSVSTFQGQTLTELLSKCAWEKRTLVFLIVICLFNEKKCVFGSLLQHKQTAETRWVQTGELYSAHLQIHDCVSL